MGPTALDLPYRRIGGRSIAAPCRSKPFAVILSPSLVILSGAKNLALPLTVNFARNLTERQGVRQPSCRPGMRAKGGSWRYRTPRCLQHKRFQSGVRDLHLILLLAGDFHLFEWSADP